MKAVKQTGGFYRFTEWSKEEMIEFLLDELQNECERMANDEENHYSYLYMLCNDMGLTVRGWHDEQN